MAPGDHTDFKKQKRLRIDWETLRDRSLLPGGFGEERAEIWPKLLNIKERKASQNEVNTPESPPHQDERQIGLDTDRSFVLYPVDPKANREALQAELHELLVTLFRKRPRLSYFQGFHDIVSVFYLTLPEDIRLACVEKLSLHRLRDAMGAGLEPVLGLLRVAKNLLRLEDPEYSQVLEQSAPLPFFALSNLLTLFSHDVPTLPLIQHVFDYLLCRPPVASVYLACAVILSRKKDAFRLAEEDEDGMIHSLLSSLPKLSDEIYTLADEIQDDSASDVDSAASTTFLRDETPATTLTPDSSPEPTTIIKVLQDESPDPVTSIGSTDGSIVGPSVSKLDEDHLADQVHDTPGFSSADAITDVQPASPEQGKDVGDSPVEIVMDDEPKGSEEPTSAHPPTELPLEDETQNGPVKESYISLSDLLKQADALYTKFPPSHSGLHLSSILGPQSVVFTWSDDFSELPLDNEAEAMVQHPELVVYPYIDVEESGKEHVENDDDEVVVEVKGFWGLRQSKGKKKASSSSAASKRRKKLRKSPFSQMEKRTMVVGTVLVLGVAVAIYGIGMRTEGADGLSFSFLEVQGGLGADPKLTDIARLGGWAAGILSTMSQRILDGLGGKGRE